MDNHTYNIMDITIKEQFPEDEQNIKVPSLWRDPDGEVYLLTMNRYFTDSMVYYAISLEEGRVWDSPEFNKISAVDGLEPFFGEVKLSNKL